MLLINAKADFVESEGKEYIWLKNVGIYLQSFFFFFSF